MYRRLRRAIVRVLWGVHRWVYLRSGGRLGGRIVGMPVLLLITAGRVTGRAHTVALTFLSTRRTFVVIASNGGARRNPDWLANLRVHRAASVRLGRDIVRVTAREARGEEREQLWRRAATAYRGYAVYQTRTSRRIPVVVLERAE